MRKLLLCILFSLVMVSCISVKKHNEQLAKSHSVNALRNDVDKLYNQLKKHHPKLYQYTPKLVMDHKFDSLKQVIVAPMTSREFYRQLAPVLTNVRQGHVSVSPQGKRFKKKEYKQLKKSKFGFNDLDFQYLDDKLWVEASYGEDSLLVGAEVISLAGEPVYSLIETYKTRIASDGFNTTHHNRFASKGFKALYAWDNGFLDSLPVQFKTKDSIFIKTYKRVLNNSNASKDTLVDSLKIKSKTKKETQSPKPTKAEKLARKREAKKQKQYNKIHGFIPRIKGFTRNFNFIGKDSAVAYMKIRSFSNGTYKGFYKTSFAKIDSAKTKNLILDLRDNGGGRIAEIQHLFAYLTDKEFQFINKSEVTSRQPILTSVMSNTTPPVLQGLAAIFSPILMVQSLFSTSKSDGKFYYKLKYAKTQQPMPLNYKGKLYVLINGNSFSASSIIATNLRGINRATFVGEETGGAYNGTVAGFYKLYKLPNSKLIVRMGLMQIEAPYKENPDGYGVRPDIKVVPTAENLMQGEDPELNWILQDIEK